MMAARLRLSGCAFAVALVAMFSAPGCGARQLQHARETRLFGKAVVLDLDLPEKRKSERMLALRTPKGALVHIEVADSSLLAGLHTGLALVATGRWAPGSSGSSNSEDVVNAAAARRPAPAVFKASALKAPGRVFTPPKVTTLEGAATPGAAGNTITLSTNKVVTDSMKTIFIPIAAKDSSGAFCPGTGPAPLNNNQLKKVLFEESNPKGPTVGGTFNRCSYNRTRLNTANSRLAPLVTLPCDGTNSDGQPWSFSTCEYADFTGYAAAADDWLHKKGIKPEDYMYRVYLVPPGACGFVGLGFVGCDGSYDCRSWIGSGYWGKPQAMVHELGHNLFMNHASAIYSDGNFDEYGDEGCQMGYCCSDRCFNTPHSWQMGWLSVQQLDGKALTPGRTVNVNLAPQATSPRSGLRILPSWVQGVEPVFLGYRTRTAADKNLYEEYAGKVNVIQSNISNAYDTSLTNWRATLAVAGDSWIQAQAGLVVRLKGFAKGAAVVSVCRKGGPETAATCAANQDNDCNGLAGARDPACAKFLPNAAARRRARATTAQPL